MVSVSFSGVMAPPAPSISTGPLAKARVGQQAAAADFAVIQPPSVAPPDRATGAP